MRAIHQRSSVFFSANARIASAMICFIGIEVAVASLRQSSYSGAALAIFPDS